MIQQVFEEDEDIFIWFFIFCRQFHSPSVVVVVVVVV
jgi:hypothetical protein